MKDGPGLIEYTIVLILVSTVVIFAMYVLPQLCLSLCCLSPILIPVWFAYQKQITKFFSGLMVQIKLWVDDFNS